MNQTRNKQGILFIISAPSGTGKTTLVRSLVKQDSSVRISVSHTTRSRRPDETEGIAYHFVDEVTFKQMISDNIFLEYARVFDFYYGTSKTWVEEQLASGYDVILEIDWQGAQQIRQKMTNTISIFILPPTFQALTERLNSRGETQATVKRRVQDAVQELSHYQEYDYLLVNNDLESALQELLMIIRVVRHQYVLQNDQFDDLVKQLLLQASNIK